MIRCTEGRPAKAAAHRVVEIGGAGAEHDDQRRAQAPGRLAHGFDEFAGLHGDPVFEAHEHDIDAAGIAREEARRGRGVPEKPGCTRRNGSRRRDPVPASRKPTRAVWLRR